MEYKRITDCPIADEFPFSNELEDSMKNNLKLKTIGYKSVEAPSEVTVKDNILQIAIRKQIDKTQFIKVFKNGLKRILELSATAQKVLWYIMDILPKNRTSVFLLNTDIMNACNFKTKKSSRDGILELLNKGILVRTSTSQKYWVNPTILFNGDRIIFITEYYNGDDVED